MDGIEMFNGQMVLSGYETEKDQKKAKKDIERTLMIVASASIYEIMKFLAPYRAKASKGDEEEYNELTEKAKNENT